MIGARFNPYCIQFEFFLRRFFSYAKIDQLANVISQINQSATVNFAIQKIPLNEKTQAVLIKLSHEKNYFHQEKSVIAGCFPTH